MRYYSEEEIDFTDEYINYSQFLLQEFFNSDDETWNKICEYYRERHGNRALSYLARKFNEWKYGNYHLTDLMEERILETMPKFLTESAKNKLSLHDFLSTIKRTISFFEAKQMLRKYNFTDLSNVKEILEMIEREKRFINNLGNIYSQFNLLTRDEKEETIKISKYILKIKLHMLYGQFRNDLNIISPFLGQERRGKISIKYTMKNLNVTFDFKNIKTGNLELPGVDIISDNMQSDGRFERYANKYMAFEMVKIRRDGLRRKTDGVLNKFDLDTFFNQYKEFANGKNEVVMNSLFKGEAGSLTINVNIVPLNLLRTALYKSIFKLSIGLLIIGGIINWILKDSDISALGPFLFLTTIFTANYFTKEVKNIIQYKNEIKNYGK